MVKIWSYFHKSIWVAIFVCFSKKLSQKHFFDNFRWGIVPMDFVALTSLMMNKNFLFWQKPLAIAVDPHNPRASQVDPNVIPFWASKVDPSAISLQHHHLLTCWWENSRLYISPRAMAVKPSKIPASERDGSKQWL